jgi:predicted ATP-binding protein involved in virulence
MIKLEHAHIEEVRGIRKLDIDFGKENFSISGPNGSGKSGVIDAIEFGLTGQIGRLTVRAVKKVDQRLGEIYEMLYDRTIQFGGHPNEKTVTQSMKLNITPGETRLDQIYLQGDGTILDHWIKTANQIGICVLKICPRRRPCVTVGR